MIYPVKICEGILKRCRYNLSDDQYLLINLFARIPGLCRVSLVVRVTEDFAVRQGVYDGQVSVNAERPVPNCQFDCNGSLPDGDSYSECQVKSELIQPIRYCENPMRRQFAS